MGYPLSAARKENYGRMTLIWKHLEIIGALEERAA